MAMYGHFWYSAEQRRTVKKLEPRRGWSYAIIAGKEVRYTEWTEDKEQFSTWDDMIYLGYGRYSHYESLVCSKCGRGSS